MTESGMRSSIREALDILMHASGDVATVLLAAPPAPGSPMALLLDGERLAECPAAAMIFHHRVAAADHVRAFLLLTGADRTFATSTAALTRAGIESFARGWWLLQSSSPEEIRHKGALVVAEELRAAGSRGIRMRDPGVDMAAAMARAEEDLAAASAGRVTLKLPRYSALAVEMMEASGTSEPRATYAHLSGIAHGEVTFTTGLAADPAAPAGEFDWLELPDDNFQHYALTLFAVNMNFMDVLVRAWGLPDVTETWHALLRASTEVLSRATE